MIQMENISKHYPGRRGEKPLQILTGVDLHIRRGEYAAIVGPSGSGKSTLMHLLGCLDTPTGGTYRLDGADVSGLDGKALCKMRQEKIGFVFQGYQLLKKLNALENVALPLMLRGVPLRRREAAAMDALCRVGLESRARHLPGQLSGGQQQRVAMARALCCSPALLLCDEPTGALDQTSRDEILSLLEGLNRSGHTIVVITHDPCVAAHALKRYRVDGGRVRPAD
jgi:putative ABC transport system ATP-binding protein